MAQILLSEQTASRINQMVKSQYNPGDKIPSETDLAELLGVGRTTIREAVKILCSRDILEIRRGLGTYVKSVMDIPEDLSNAQFIDEEQLILSLFEMSELIEPKLVELAAIKATDEQIAEMKKIHRQFEDLLAQNRGEIKVIPERQFRMLDVKFHMAVIMGCDNQIITRSLPMYIDNCTEWYKVWTNIDFAQAVESFKFYHSKILAAIETRNSDLAYKYSLEHTREIIGIYKSKKTSELKV